MIDERRVQKLAILILVAGAIGVGEFSKLLGVDWGTGFQVLSSLVGFILSFVLIGLLRKEEPLFGLPIFIPALISGICYAMFPALDFWSENATFGFSFTRVAWFDQWYFKTALVVVPLLAYIPTLRRYFRERN